MCTQEIMYGESITSFSNFKVLLNHRKMLVCLFIVVWLLRAFKLLRFPSFFCKNADFYTKNGRVNFGGFSGLPEQNYEVFFVYYGNLDFFWQLLPTSCIVGVWFWPMKLQQTLSLLVDLNLNPLVWSVVMQIKRFTFQPLVWNWRESFSQPIETVERLNQLAVLWFMHY